VQQPSIGRIVHYQAHGTPIRQDGTQAYGSVCRAAVVTQVHSDKLTPANGVLSVGLAVLNPTGMFFHESIPHDPDHSGGSWHWPEYVEDRHAVVEPEPALPLLDDFADSGGLL